MNPGGVGLAWVCKGVRWESQLGMTRRVVNQLLLQLEMNMSEDVQEPVITMQRSALQVGGRCSS